MKTKRVTSKGDIALSIVQMRYLRDLGIDTSDASMCWVRDPNEGTYQLFIHDEYCHEVRSLAPEPAYTLEDILLKFRGQLDYNTEIAELKPLLDIDEEENEKCPWTYEPDHKIGTGKIIIGFGKSPLDAAYKGILRLFSEQLIDKLLDRNEKESI